MTKYPEPEERIYPEIPSSEPITDLVHCEQMGFESVVYGANTKNCNYRIFLNEASKEAWEKGKKRAKK